MARWLLTRLGRRKGVGTTPFGCPRTSSPIWRGLKWCGFQRRLKAKNGFGGFGGLAYKLKWRFKPKQAKLNTWIFVAQVPHKVMVARFKFKHHVAPLLSLGCLHVLHLLVLYMVGCLCHDSNPWATYMVWLVCRKLHKVTFHGTWTSWGMYFICVPWTQTIG